MNIYENTTKSKSNEIIGVDNPTYVAKMKITLKMAKIY
jgi:hypothetical protein